MGLAPGDTIYIRHPAGALRRARVGRWGRDSVLLYVYGYGAVKLPREVAERALAHVQEHLT